MLSGWYFAHTVVCIVDGRSQTCQAVTRASSQIIIPASTPQQPLRFVVYACDFFENVQVVTVCPEIMVHERGSSQKEELLLLVCDGVWDVFSDEDAGEFLVSMLDVPLGEVRTCARAALCVCGHSYRPHFSLPLSD